MYEYITILFKLKLPLVVARYSFKKHLLFEKDKIKKFSACKYITVDLDCSNY